jgi:hypothetical protein
MCIAEDNLSERLRIDRVLDPSPRQEVTPLAVGELNLDSDDVLHG